MKEVDIYDQPDRADTTIDTAVRIGQQGWKARQNRGRIRPGAARRPSQKAHPESQIREK